jgi:hypothetical protein
VPNDPDVRRYHSNWFPNREAIAGVLAQRQFQIVASAFASLDYYLHFLLTDHKPEGNKALLRRTTEALGQARLIVWEGGGGDPSELPRPSLRDGTDPGPEPPASGS